MILPAVTMCFVASPRQQPHHDGTTFLLVTRTTITRGTIIQRRLPPRKQTLALKGRGEDDSNFFEFPSSSGDLSSSRRALLRCGAALSVATFSSSSTVPVAPLAAADDGEVPEEEAASSSGGLVSRNRAAALLRSVPTFALVDGKGVPYMVVGEDAKITSYFFIDYAEADRILQVAKKSADRAIAEAKRDPGRPKEDLANPWKDARISTVPLDTAVTLVTKSALDRGIGNKFLVAPTESTIEDALAVIGKDDLAEGKVPLFYYPDWTVEDASTGDKQSPLYFSKADL
jgi:hypothetical protein